MQTVATASPRFDNTKTNASPFAAFLAVLRRAFELSGAPYAGGALPPL